MKIKTTTILIILFLLSMMGASATSAIVGYKIGYQSLKGVSQPDINPTRKLRNKEKNNTEEGVSLVDEKSIIVQNYNYIVSQSKKNQDEKKVNETPKSTALEEKKNEVNSENKKSEKNLNLNTENKGLTLELKKIKKQDEAIIFDVNLTNNSNKSVSFVYTFLELKDDKDRFLSAVVDGLPRNLPANGNKFSGTITIPIFLLQDSEKLFLTLTDYPNQDINLQINNIPVKIDN